MSDYPSQDIENQAYALGLKLEKEKLSQLEIADAIRMKGFDTPLSEKVARDMIVERDRRNRKQGKKMMLRGAVVLLFGWGITMYSLTDGQSVGIFAYGAIGYGVMYLLVGTWKFTS